MGATNRTSTGRAPAGGPLAPTGGPPASIPGAPASIGGAQGRRAAMAALALALGVVAGGCSPADGPGTGDAPLPEAAIPSEAADTASLPPIVEPDDRDPAADSAEAARTGDTDAESPDAAGELGDTTDSLSATDDSAAAEAPPPPLRIPPGTRVRLAAETDISTDAYDVGDPVIATVVRDVLDDEGEVLISTGTYFLGRVEASASSGGIGEPAILEVAFETLSAWNYERPIEGIVVDVSVTLDEEAERARRTARGRDAMRMVPGVIRAGTTIVVQLRDPVFVPPLDTLAVPPDSTAIPPDSTPTGGLPDTAAAGDAAAGPPR